TFLDAHVDAAEPGEGGSTLGEAALFAALAESFAAVVDTAPPELSDDVARIEGYLQLLVAKGDDGALDDLEVQQRWQEVSPALERFHRYVFDTCGVGGATLDVTGDTERL